MRQRRRNNREKPANNKEKRKHNTRTEQQTMGNKADKKKNGPGGSKKSIRAHQQQELQRRAEETVEWTRQERTAFIHWTKERQKQRPKLVCLHNNNTNPVHRLLRDRRRDDASLFRERRRRNGFLPTPVLFPSSPHHADTTTTSSSLPSQQEVLEGTIHPPGWILTYDDCTSTTNDDQVGSATVSHGVVTRLQHLALKLFAKHIHDYAMVMGCRELRRVLSLLSSQCLMELSITVCSSSRTRTDTGLMDDTIAVLVGQHPHIERLCLRGSSSSAAASLTTITATKPAATTTTTKGRNKNNGLNNSNNRSTHNHLSNTGIEQLIPKVVAGPAANAANDSYSSSYRKNTIETIINDNDNNNNEINNNIKNNNKINNNHDSNSVPDCWEDESDTDDDDNVDAEYYDDRNTTNCGGTTSRRRRGSGGTITMDGCNINLRRLELLDLSGNTIPTADTILRWFEICSGITHLSLAGSFSPIPSHPIITTVSSSSFSVARSHPNNNNNENRYDHHHYHHSIGRQILLSIPQLLPHLEVLDVTRCLWVTESLLTQFLEQYCSSYLSSSSSCNHSNQQQHHHQHVEETNASLAFSFLPIIFYHRGRFTLSRRKQQEILQKYQKHVRREQQQRKQHYDQGEDQWW